MSPIAQPDRPAFEVTAGGSALSAADAADVIDIDVHEEIGRHARCTMLVQNWNQDERAVRHSDGSLYAPGGTLAVALGFHSDLTQVFDGVVASVTAHFPADGPPVMRVEARSKSILLEHPPRSRQLAEVSDADVASAIASDYSLSADADTGVTRESVVSDRTSDWDFLKARAATLGWALYVRGDSLVMRAPAAADNPPSFAFTHDLLEAHLTEDITRAIDEATGVAWDVSAKDVAESQQGASAAGIDTGARSGHDSAVGDAGWPLRSRRDESPADLAGEAADARAVGRQADAALAHVHGTAVVSGTPTLRCDGWVELTGLGERLSGPHYLSAVRHRLSAQGYRTELQLGKPPAIVPPAPQATQASGAVTLGIVADLEDPDGLNRVKVRMPWRADGGDGVWARLATLDAGDDYGTVFVPNVDQEVLVAYVDGEPSYPVVIGQMFNGAAAPPLAIDPDANAVRMIKTPGGHVLSLDDSDSAAVSIESAKGHSIVIDDSNGAIVLTHKDSGNAITVSGDGIELSAAQGDVTVKSSSGTFGIDALKIEGKASGPSTLESSATLDIKASGPLGLKGALVNIN